MGEARSGVSLYLYMGESHEGGGVLCIGDVQRGVRTRAAASRIQGWGVWTEAAQGTCQTIRPLVGLRRLLPPTHSGTAATSW
jgi:hypothetical protein